jgi:hypothetical protein
MNGFRLKTRQKFSGSLAPARVVTAGAWPGRDGHVLSIGSLDHSLFNI